MIDHSEVAYLELTEVSELIRARQFTSREVTEAILARMDALDPTLQSYVHPMPDVALAAADAADDDLAHGRHKGPLHGVPIGVKDLCYTTDAPTGSGGTMHAEYRSLYDATVVTRLRRAGAVITGKLRMTEGAYTNHHPALPVPVNPWHSDTWSGVSSSGSGVATAAGLCFGSLGSDTGGSIRLPSSANGVTGVMPTWGRVSRYGVVELAGSMDHIGPMCRSAKDCAAMLGVIAGSDHNDPTSSTQPVPDYLHGLTRTTRPRLGIDRSLLSSFDETTRQMLRNVLEVVRDLGWQLLDVDTPDLPGIAADFAALCAAEAATAHADTYPSRADEYGQSLRDALDSGRSMTATDLVRLQTNRRAFTGRLGRVFEGIDLLLMPAVGFASPTVETLETLGTNADLLAALLTPTAPFDMAGVPTVTLPGGFTDRGTPLGFQFVARPFEEQLMLQAAHAFQQVTAFHRSHPQPVTNARLEGVAQ
ncbi:putative amidase AmiD [Rhodococcoides trifolii]|uniref:Amidase AmiD n=1 Tax=Rhodococcoides trifolii TaxID=908250 RepID=A0A917D1M9_9NOCA|nr:amidase [Rhodococcus trifolii]GGG03283.1 putative amidase AmiD [Rhodococcus trifolii]